MEARSAQKLKTRRKLIEVALELSTEKGFSALSLREVAQAADLTPAAFYRHFRDMEELGLALLDEVGLSLRRFLREARKRANRDQGVVQASVDAFMEYVNENANLFRLLLGERQGASTAFRKAIHAETDQFVGELTEDLERESRASSRPMLHPSYAAEAIVAVVFTVGAEALELPKHKQESLSVRLVEEVKMILRGARASAPASKNRQKKSLPVILLAVATALGLSLGAPVAQASVAPSQLQSQLKEVREKAADPSRWVAEARLLYRLGAATESEEQKKKFFEEGLRISSEARKVEPKNPGAILQWTIHAGSLAEMNKDLGALRTIKEIEKALLELREIAPQFESAAADRALGTLYQKAPNLVSIGSMSKAGKHLRAAYALDPAYPGNQIALADYLFEIGDKSEARKLAQNVLKSDQLEKNPHDSAKWTLLAKRIVEKTR